MEPIGILIDCIQQTIERVNIKQKIFVEQKIRHDQQRGPKINLTLHIVFFFIFFIIVNVHHIQVSGSTEKDKIKETYPV